MNTKSQLLGTVGLALLATPMPALAQSDQGNVDYESANHGHWDQEIVVTGALRLVRADALSSVAVLDEAKLAGAARPSIGETLAKVPGVSASSFGPSASRPVLRGLDGERVRVLSDGIGAIDASNTSADHASAINPLLAERIEVLRGPQSLQFGSAAIGGVVNVITRRIPNAVPDEAVHVDALATYGSAAEERSIGASIEVPIAPRWVLHADGSYQKSDDLRIPGYVLTPALRADALAAGVDEESGLDLAANAALRGRLPNTAARTWNAGVGGAFIDEGGSIGVAYSRLDNLYGLPVRFATQQGQEQEAPRIQLKQDRIDARAELTPRGDLIDRISFRFGFADYRHFELEEDGAVGTSFYTKGLEGRLEVVQAERGPWHGASGAQFTIRDFNVVGEEAFLPKSESRELGLFTVQQYETGPLKLEAGLRYEHSRIEAQPGISQPQFYSGARSFDAFSLAFGGAYTFAPGWKFGLNLSRTERAPAAEELFANGPHAGTGAFEIGDPLLRKENARSVEAILRGNVTGLTVELSAYHIWFGNFIYEALTPDFEDGLPVYRVNQADAQFAGFEAQASATLAKFGDWKLEADVLADYVRATIDSAGPAPRIPPLRVAGGLGLSSHKFDLRGEVEHVTAQNRIAASETRTPGHTLVNLEANWRPWGRERPLTLVLSANNIFDVEARRHASVLKDYAPLAGRDIRISARIEI